MFFISLYFTHGPIYLLSSFIFDIVVSGTDGENMIDKDRPIAVYDSGVGGISVLKKMVRLLPHEDFIYYGDSLNAPYGSKPIQEIKKLTFQAIDYLMARGVKAIVIACNTATSAAIDEVRKAHPELPIFGIEPALKPAVEVAPEGSIIVMATELTLKEKKFDQLVVNVARSRQVIKMSCPGLVELIETGQADSALTREYLSDKFKDLDRASFNAVVLGCTHYAFILKTLQEVIGNDKIIVDGADGIARHLSSILSERNLLTKRTGPGEVQILNSAPGDDLLKLSMDLLIFRDIEPNAQ